MGLWRDLFTWGYGPEPTPPRGQAATSRPARSGRGVAFELNAPAELLTGGSTTGALAPRVGRDEALTVGAVRRARDLIAGTLGTLPLRLLDTGRNSISSELLEQPEDDVARSVTMTRTVEDMFFEERAWWRITEFGAHGYPSKVRRLEPRSVLVQTDAKVYVSSDGGRPQGIANEIVPDAELIRFDSPNPGLLKSAARAIRMAIALDQRADLYTKDPLPLGYFSPADGMADQDPDEIQPLLDAWESSRTDRAWGYVGAALKANTLQWDPEKLQLAQARNTAVLEIARHAGIDAEDLGVSTTTRTYQNAEQRRLDLVDFTLAAYVAALESRLSMRDIFPPGHQVQVDYAGFLRSDTLTRMQTYEVGRRVGVYDDKRIAEIEKIPTAKPQAAPAPAPTAAPEESTVQQSQARPVAAFADDSEPITISFDSRGADAQFAADSAKRTVSGITVPWNQVARSGYAKWKFAPNSLHWGDQTSRVKLNRDHDRYNSFGRATTLESTEAGLFGVFKVGRGQVGDDMLAAAEDEVYDGFSIEIDFEEGDGWIPDPVDESVRLVQSATLRAVAQTAMPAFDGARVAHVAASQTPPGAPAPESKEIPAMTAPAPEQQPAAPAVPAAPAAGPTQPAAPAAPAVSATAPVADLTQFAASIGESISTAVAEAFAKIPFPQHPTPPPAEQRQVVPAGRAVVTRESPVYSMNGYGHSLVRDAWFASRGDADARDRLTKFERQTNDVARDTASAMFAANTTNAAAVVPPGYRPDLYVTQLMKGRPLVSGVSRGSIENATPFTIPSFTSSSGLSADHTEGTNPTAGSITLGTVTVTPKGISGLFQVTREIVDSSNPAIDAIALQAMGESYSQQTEAKVYAKVNGANGVGGTITNGFVPSGAQVTTTTGGSAGAGTYGGKELIAGIRLAESLYPFRRFQPPTDGFVSQEGTSALATAVDSDGRPLLPPGNSVNSPGSGHAGQSWNVDNVDFVPAWSMTGNAAGDADAVMWNSADVWAWESGVLTFRYEERNGPALIDLALFGYFATEVLRPVGLVGIRHTVGA